MAEDEAPVDERQVELETLTSIYPELQISASDPFAASLVLPIALDNPLEIRFDSPTTHIGPNSALQPLSQDEEKASALKPKSVRYLPPLHLNVRLPNDYPEISAPHVAIQCSWAARERLDPLERHVSTMWENAGRAQILFDYIDALQQTAQDALGLAPVNGGSIVLPAKYEASILDFDLKERRLAFERQTFTCAVCLEPKKGTVSHQLDACGHVFCLECLRDCYNTCITEGDVSSVKCMASDCTTLKPSPGTKGKKRCLRSSELERIGLAPEQVARYTKLRRKKRFESKKSTIYCPRPWCQGIAHVRKANAKRPNGDVHSESDEDDSEPNGGEINEVSTISKTTDSITTGEAERKVPATTPNSTSSEAIPKDRLAVCEDCGLAFCILCKTSWHGDFLTCKNRTDELTAEEKATQTYLEAHSAQCPVCAARCQKTEGCNHMICFQCRTHFCYLCNAWLPPDNPYRHFNEEGQPCFQRLWELERGEPADLMRVAPARAANRPRPEPQAEAEPIIIGIVANRPDAAAEAGPADAGRNILAAPRRQRPMPHRDLEVRPPPPPPPPPPPLVPRRGGHAGSDRWEIAAAEAQAENRARRRPVEHDVLRAPAPDGLQRFLAMALNDEEDDWDSDELEDLEIANRDGI